MHAPHVLPVALLRVPFMLSVGFMGSLLSRVQQSRQKLERDSGPWNDS